MKAAPLNPDLIHHQIRVGEYAYKLSLLIGLSEKIATYAMLCGRLHDVGKFMIPEDILCKPGKLTEEEFDIIKEHSMLGGDYLRNEGVSEIIWKGVKHHHESCDGSGYPSRLKTLEIPLLSRIIKIVDVYDALTTSRVYRNYSYSPKESIKIMDGMISQFDWAIYISFKHYVLDSSTLNNDSLKKAIHNISNEREVAIWKKFFRQLLELSFCYPM